MTASPFAGADRPGLLTRRSAVQAAVLSGAAAALAACTSSKGSAGSAPTAASPRASQPTSPVGTATTSPTASGGSGQVLLVYFSRAGENYWHGGRRTLQVGNTELVAGVISDLITCDVHRIEAADPYSDDYEDTVARNGREQQTDARPAIAGALPSTDGYATVLLGSPIWNVRTPMIMSTLVEGLDLTGKRVLPFVTYAVSGLASVPQDYADLAPTADIGEGLAIQGETVTEAPDDVRTDVEQWLRTSALLTS